MPACRIRARIRRQAATARRVVVGGLILGLTAPWVAGSASAAGTRSALPTASNGQTAVPMVIYTDDPLAIAGARLYREVTADSKVTVLEGTPSQLVAKIEAQKSHPQWDVLWMRGDEAVATLDAQGLLERDWAPRIPFTPVARQIIPKDRSYAPITLTMAAAVVYNTRTVARPPTSWGALTSPAFRGAVGMTDPVGSSLGYPYVAGMAQSLGGVAQGEAFYEQLKANGLHLYANDAATLRALERGTIKFATIPSSVGLQASLATHHDIKVTYLRPETVLPSVIAVDGRLSKTDLVDAKWIASLMYSPAGQESLLRADPKGASLFWPVEPGFKPQPSMPPLSSVPTQVINASTWSRREASIDAWFTQNIVR